MEENVDKSPEVWGAIMAMVLIGSCANTPYHQVKQESEKIPPKIEQRQKIATNQVHRISQAYFVKIR